MSNLSPSNKIISSISRSKYIDKLRGNIGVIKENCRTPLHHKLYDTYEGITTNIPVKIIVVFITLFIVNLVVLNYFKPFFVLRNESNQKSQKLTKTKANASFKISSMKTRNSKNDDNEEEDSDTADSVSIIKKVSYYKLISYSLLISLLLIGCLYLLRNKVKHIGMLFDIECNK
jgi:hypothetical protein